MQVSNATVREFIDNVSNAKRRRDAEMLLELIGNISGEPPRMWGPSIVGFGQYHYRYASGREGDAPAAGFSPRTAATSVYLADGVGAYAEQLVRLGDHTTGVGCLYLKDLDKVDLNVLEAIIRDSFVAIIGHDRSARGPAAD